MTWKKVLLFAMPVIVILAAFFLFAACYGDWLWFQHLGFSRVYTTSLFAKSILFAVFFIIFAILGSANLYIAGRVGAHARSTQAVSPVSPASVFSILFHNRQSPFTWAVVLALAIGLWAKLLAIAAGFLVFSMVAGIKIYVSEKRRNSDSQREADPPRPFARLLDRLFQEKHLLYLWALTILILSTIMGLKASHAWMTFLKFMHPSPFSVSEPVFSKNAGFYVFSLPLYQFLKQWCALSLLFILCTIGISYYTDQAIGIKKGKRIYVSSGAKIHLATIGGLVALVMAWSYRLKMYGLMYSSSGVVRGPGYADIHAQLPAYWLLLVVCILLALLFFALPALKKWNWAAYGIGVYLISLIAFSWIFPRIVERYVVKPNELARETPYIKNNIRFTRIGFGLDKASEEPFPAADSLSYDDIRNNEATIHNIRLWDHRPLIQTYKQLQEIRLYYNFKNLDIDRYDLRNKYTEVALSARGLPVSKLPNRAKTWVNIHLVYTHGYGVVMSPVNEFTPDGMPRFVVQDIPPISSTSLSITRPEIYYGEQTSQFTIVHSTTREFDYPKGNRNVYTTYQGTGGVPISSWFRRLVYSLKFSDLNILMSDYITDKSRLMFRRVITKRDRTIAPFLTYDSDPYIVVGTNGHLYWIHDAYTTTRMFPYSQALRGDKTATNYIRNSVEVVVDAYSGNVSYYITDPSDPLVRTYSKIFPTLFKPASEMPASLKAHLRYPRDIFLMQAKMYATYHMTDPKVFYNREDLWSIPKVGNAKKKQSMLPYYIIMKLPGTKTEEFILMLPMTPSKKDNMVAWMCARCDGKNRGQLLIYTLPKDKLIYGPRQIEARINQEPSITSELTLWGQIGSSVIRGNLLVIPIDHSFLYVEPIYLQSNSGQMPQLKRVIAIQGGQLDMRKNLDAALQAIFSKAQVPEGQRQKAFSGLPAGMLPEMAREALGHYNKALKYLDQANWSKYGEELDRLRQILQTMTGSKKKTP